MPGDLPRVPPAWPSGGATAAATISIANSVSSRPGLMLAESLVPA